MPELTPLLERAAAKPRGAPEVDQTWRHARSRALLVRGGALITIVCVAGVVAVTARSKSTARVAVASPRVTTSAYRDGAHGFTAQIPDGWYRATAALVPGQTEPHQILAAATIPLSAPTIQPALSECDVSYPTVAIDSVGSSGALVWVAEWAGSDAPARAPRSERAADLPWTGGCGVPGDATVQSARFRDAGRSFDVVVAIGRDASAERRLDAYALIDSLHFDLAYRDNANGFSVTIPNGWHRSSASLAPWLYSPHEILSLGTAPLAPLPQPGNQAACPSEIPRAAIDAIGHTGVYLWVGEWVPGSGEYTTVARPARSATAAWEQECKLPGVTTRGLTFRDSGRNFSASVVIGDDALPAQRAQVYEVFDSLRFDAKT